MQGPDGAIRHRIDYRKLSPPAASDLHAPSYRFETIDEITAGSPVRSKPWIIKGIIARGETSAWIAPPGGMKSALITELCVCTAWGDDWHGYKSKRIEGAVYFALERADLVRRRIRAHIARWSGQAGRDPEDYPSITVVASTVDLMDTANVRKVVETIRNIEEVAGSAGLLVFDTFAKLIAAGGGDEDKAKDQGRVFANIQRIKDALDPGRGTIGPPHVALIGHTGKDEARGARGSNAILGDVDVMVTISGDQIKTATITKANDAPEGPLFSFKSQTWEFGTDEDGDPVTVNIVSSEDVIARAEPDARQPKLTANQKTMFGILYAAGAAGLTQEAWNEQGREAGIGVKRKADLVDARNGLLGKGMVRRYADRWRVNHG